MQRILATYSLCFWALLVAVLHPSASACVPGLLKGTNLRSGEPIQVDPSKAKRATVVVFLSARCPCSRAHEIALGELSKGFPDFDFVAVHSNSNEPLGEAQIHFEKAPFAFPVIRDEDAALANAFGALKTPHAFIVGRAQECLFNGGVDDSRDSTRASQHYLRDALALLQQGREPTMKVVRTLGCVIQR